MAIGELDLNLEHVQLHVAMVQRNGLELVLHQLLLTEVEIATDRQTIFEIAK